MITPPLALRILPPADQIDAVFEAEARILTMLATRFPEFDFTLAQSPRPPGAGLMIVPAGSGDPPPDQTLERIRAAIATLLG